MEELHLNYVLLGRRKWSEEIGFLFNLFNLAHRSSSNAFSNKRLEFF